ncbi:TonB-linked outer membrane protein, SusC/RagA family [Hyunsoonleella jejuensis]|uniref:TonB-linked outer membrane protein, SusC/RagA family n=1 Tax=Hyunsoonleella jejuensis TaxID=419940 RepID=A0A1H9ICC3_9FLAO|nr:TonB-dependent receptor [Hyunsoonleella jejuensis]SEQ72196.1 TonB-linked outer membrane protein, SusC/RagA family [Hyunsoonleella jejuensis]
MKTKFSGLLTLLLALVVQLSFAQEKTISGTVSDESGLPLPGTTVLVKGTTNGTSTDFDGKYSIKVNQGRTLVFSFVGYANKEVSVGTSNTINVVMSEDASALEEVVVVAYGTQTKQSIVGSVGVVSTEVIETQQVTSPLRALQGAVPGVNLLTAGGQPGTNPTIRIRGFSSLNADASPLIILDGAQFNGNINTISQDQIESMSVLKDASSTSLYGSRGANGVILITTKKGKRNSAPRVTVRTQIGLSNPTVGVHDLLSTDDQFRLTWEARRNENLYGLGQSPAEAAENASAGLVDYFGYNPYGNIARPVDVNGNLVTTNKLWDTNWENELLRRDYLRKNHNINLQGGDEKTTYFVSFDYLNEEGPVVRSNFERIAARANIESQVNDWLKIGFNTSFSRSNSGNPDQTSNSTTQVISWIYGVSSAYPIFSRDGNGNIIPDVAGNPQYDLGNGANIGQSVNNVRTARGGQNVLAELFLGRENRRRTSYLGNAFAEIQITEWLKARTNLSYENYLFDTYSFDDDLLSFASNVGGRVDQDRDITTTLNAIQSLNFNKTFGNHNISADLITEAYTFEFDNLGAQGTGFLPNVSVLDGATAPEAVTGNVVSERINSYLGRLAYNFNQKYYIEGSYRRDGSTRFSEDTRWGDFFSIGGSWVVSNESFLEDSNTLNYLKLRGSYGELGNNRITFAGTATQDYFPYQSIFNLGWNNEGNTGILLAGVADPNISWEKTQSLNVGVDFELFNGVLSGTVDYYEKESVDLIYAKPIPSSTGVDNIITNIGAIKNSGWEVSLNSRNVSTEDFTWTTGINFSLDKNEITELTQDEFINGSKLWKVGNSIFDWYIREWAGVDPADGFGMWYQDILDADGEVTGRTVTKDYDEATRYETGTSSLPDIIGGFTSFIKYKQFDLNVLVNFSFGGSLLDTDYSGLISQFSNPGVAHHTDILNRWQQPGDITDFPLVYTGNNNHASRSTRFLFDNDYVRLKALTLGYNLPSSVIERIGLSSFRLFVQADNIFTWQSHKGIDPEQAFNGLTNNRSPLSKTITTGAIVQF